MKLDDYLKSNDISVINFAEQIGRSKEIIWAYIRNARRPSETTMKKIYDHTGGLVQPNDFYDMSDRAPL